MRENDFDQRVIPEFQNDWREFNWVPNLNQDFNSMEQMAAGGRSPAFLGHHIYVVQEMMLFYVHETADQYFFGAPLPERKVVG